MAYYCQACGKEMDREEEFCEECKESMSILDGEPVKPTAAPAPTPTAPLMNEPKKGNGPAIAALILSIIGFFITIAMVGVFSMMIKMPEFTDAFVDTMRQMGTSGFPPTIMEFSVKMAFSLYYYAGGLFMLLGGIFALIALVKYGRNTTPNKSKAVLVMAIIAAVFVVLSFIIATVGFADASKIIENTILPRL
jgi:uncharacterized membrane protein